MTVVGQVRDVVNPSYAGSSDFVAEPDQSKWDPEPSTPTGRPGFQRL